MHDYTKDLSEISTRLRKIRESQSHSQEQMAELLDISRIQVHRMEAGTAWMNVETLLRYSNELHTPITSFLPPQYSEFGTNDLNAKYGSSYARLSTDQKRSFDQFVSAALQGFLCAS